MPRLILANQSTAAKRRVYLDLRDATDGITAETGEAGGQPQISTNGAAWTNTGIGTLTHIGNGRYYADLTQAAVQSAGDLIETRYKSAATAETPGDSFQVVAFDPDDAVRLGLTAFPNVASGNAGALITAGTGTAQLSVSSGNPVMRSQDTMLVRSATAQAGAASTITLDAGASATNDIFRGQFIRIHTGTGALQSRFISAYNGTTKVATVNRAWDITPDNTSVFCIYSFDLDGLADAVWDEILDGSHHQTLASAGGFMQRQASFAEGTVQAATSTTVQLDSFMSSVDNYYRDCLIGITTGTGLQQLRIIQSYVGATRTCVLASDRPWAVTPVALVSTWEIYTAGPASVTNVSDNSVTNIGAPITTIVSGSTPAEIWGYASRTLTQAAAAVIAAVTGAELAWLRGDALEQTFTGLGSLADRTRLWLTIKRDVDDADADAVLQIEETGGILVLNGEPPDAPIDGELVVNDEDTGAVTLTLTGLVMAQLPHDVTLYYDIQMLLDGEPVTVTSSTCGITADVTRRVA